MHDAASRTLSVLGEVLTPISRRIVCEGRPGASLETRRGARFTRRKSPLAVGASTPSSFTSSDDLAGRDHDLAEGRSDEIADLPESR